VSGIAVRILIVAAIAVGGIVLRDRLSSGAGDLKVGDCFDTTQATEVKDVQHHPCTEKHNAEVVLVTSYPSVKGAPYPNDPDVQTYGDNVCGPAVASYAGPNARLDRLNYGIFYPKADDWKDGDRGVICYALNSDMSPMTSSLKAGG
jgi:hypothetical protein